MANIFNLTLIVLAYFVTMKLANSRSLMYPIVLTLLQFMCIFSIVEVNGQTLGSSYNAFSNGNVQLRFSIGQPYAIYKSDQKLATRLDQGQILSSVIVQKKLDRSDFICYPTPASGYINIKTSGHGMSKIQIVDIKGALIKGQRNSIYFKKSLIDIRDIAPGVYYIKVWDEKGNLGAKKIIITNNNHYK